MLFHHNRTLEGVAFSDVRGAPEHSNADFRDAYRWLQRQVGFYPVFVAVGATDDDIRMTGYQGNWAVNVGWRSCDGRTIPILRRKGEFPNYVLFSYRDVQGVFTDYRHWHMVLNASHKNYEMSEQEKRLIFKPSWTKARWLRKAHQDPHSVQLVAPHLSLSDADLIRVRNRETQKLLERMGFRNVEVARLPVCGD